MNPGNGDRRLPQISRIKSGIVGSPSILTGYHVIGHGENNLWTSYSGMDDTGIPLHLTRWKIDISKLFPNSSSSSICGKKLPQLVDYIKFRVQKLINLPQKENLVQFKNVHCSMNESILTVSVAREVVNGLSIKALSKTANWNIHRVRQIANALLECLVVLHNNGLTHGNISDTTVFIDENGTWKVADYTINSYLNHLASYKTEPYEQLSTKTDLFAIADLIESFGMSSFHLNDFVKKCRSNLTETISELTEHALLQSLHKSFEDFVVLRKLGEGGFGQVLKVRDLRIEQNYAIKRIKETKMTDLNKANKEIKTIANLTNKHVVKYYRSWTETMNESEFKSYEEKNGKVSDEDVSIGETAPKSKRKREKTIYVMYIQMELCEHDLRKPIVDEGLQNDMPRAKRYFFGIAEGLKFIHSKGIIHRDLKPENIFIKNDTVKIGDFGLATTRKSMSKVYCGTKKYIAPEIGKQGIKARADMYSFGIILFEMCFAIENREERDRILGEIRKVDAPIERYVQESHEFYETIKNLLNHDVKKRYTAAKLLDKHPGYKDYLQSISNGNTLTSK